MSKKKLNNKTLGLVFIVLLGIVALTKYISNKKGENTFHTHIISVDSTKITSILIYPKKDPNNVITFFRKNGTWMVKQGNITSRADQTSKTYLLKQVNSIKPSSLVAKNESDWKNYDVTDSLATRIKVMNGNKAMLDLYIGRFRYVPATRSGESYIRLAGQNEVYGVDGFLSMSINGSFNAWRDKELVSKTEKDWTKLTFTYPGDSSFVMQKANQKWMINNKPTDSTSTARYLQSLPRLRYGTFMDKFKPAPGQQPMFSLKIEGNNISQPIVLTAYKADSINEYAIHSTLNPDAYFSGKKAGIFDLLYAGSNKLMNPPPAPPAHHPKAQRVKMPRAVKQALRKKK